MRAPEIFQSAAFCWLVPTHTESTQLKGPARTLLQIGTRSLALILELSLSLSLSNSFVSGTLLHKLISPNSDSVLHSVTPPMTCLGSPSLNC